MLLKKVIKVLQRPNKYLEDNPHNNVPQPTFYDKKEKDRQLQEANLKFLKKLETVQPTYNRVNFKLHNMKYEHLKKLVNVKLKTKNKYEHNIGQMFQSKHGQRVMSLDHNQTLSHTNMHQSQFNS